jgi:AraC-like DNA-binding protein
MDYVEDNIDKKITISDLANRSRWKEQHFMVLLIILRNTLSVYFEKKICKAKKLIKDTKFTFSEISFELGFQSYGNFAMPLKDNRKDSNLSGSFILER